MKVAKIFQIIIVLFLFLQFVLFIFVKQKFVELERKNAELEEEIGIKLNENNLLKIKLTTVQNQYRVRKLLEKLPTELRAFKPNQVIEKEAI